jgi:hypothetical protein
LFESAELGHAITRQTYARQVPKLREALLDAQYDLFQDERFQVIVLIGGMDSAGKSETVNLLNEWMDPRHISTVAFGEPSGEERQRPPMWRYWQALPPKGKIGILFGHWYTQPIRQRVNRDTDHSQLVQQIAEIVRFEQMLGDEGALVLKFWFHLSKVAQKKKLKALEKDPNTRWKVSGHGVGGLQALRQNPQGRGIHPSPDQHRDCALDRSRGHGRTLSQPDDGAYVARRHARTTRPETGQGQGRSHTAGAAGHRPQEHRAVVGLETEAGAQKVRRAAR